MSYSLTYSGAILMFLSFIFKFAGVPFIADEWQITINSLMQLGSVVMVIWGRYRAGGINILGFKK